MSTNNTVFLVWHRGDVQRIFQERIWAVDYCVTNGWDPDYDIETMVAWPSSVYCGRTPKPPVKPREAKVFRDLPQRREEILRDELRTVLHRLDELPSGDHYIESFHLRSVFRCWLVDRILDCSKVTKRPDPEYDPRWCSWCQVVWSHTESEICPECSRILRRKPKPKKSDKMDWADIRERLILVENCLYSLLDDK